MSKKKRSRITLCYETPGSSHKNQWHCIAVNCRGDELYFMAHKWTWISNSLSALTAVPLQGPGFLGAAPVGSTPLQQENRPGEGISPPGFTQLSEKTLWAHPPEIWTLLEWLSCAKTPLKRWVCFCVLCSRQSHSLIMLWLHHKRGREKKFPWLKSVTKSSDKAAGGNRRRVPTSLDILSCSRANLSICWLGSWQTQVQWALSFWVCTHRTCFDAGWAPVPAPGSTTASSRGSAQSSPSWPYLQVKVYENSR